MICKRTAMLRDADFQTREEDGRRYIEGYFAVFGGKYWLWEDDGGAYETIEPGAFDLNADIRPGADESRHHSGPGPHHGGNAFPPGG